MKAKIANRFLTNYIIMFFISTLIAVFIFLLMGFASDLIAKNLVKNRYTAKNLMQDDYEKIDALPVVQNGGGIQVIDEDYRVILSKGLAKIVKSQLTAAEFTDFLTASKATGVRYSFDIAYNENREFWLVVTFPTSIRFDFAIASNLEEASVDTNEVAGVIFAIVLFYLLLLALSTVVYSKITSVSFVNPLKELGKSASRLKEGDYSARVNLHLKNEFGELEEAFNAMAGKIEEETALRKSSEEQRKKLILELSHDLKNPFASIVGYTELCLAKKDLNEDEREKYLKIIYNNSSRANKLINGLFELSKLESAEFKLTKEKTDVCEYLREEIAKNIPALEDAGFKYEFYIPDCEVFACLDKKLMDRVFQNLFSNAVSYNKKDTMLTVGLEDGEKEICITFKDNGIGMPPELAENSFQPFVRRLPDAPPGGSGLGLSIVFSIIEAHGGKIALTTKENEGCEFTIRLPKDLR
jgi:signal transduction histidine kinase